MDNLDFNRVRFPAPPVAPACRVCASDSTCMRVHAGDVCVRERSERLKPPQEENGGVRKKGWGSGDDKMHVELVRRTSILRPCSNLTHPGRERGWGGAGRMLKRG